MLNHASRIGKRLMREKFLILLTLPLVLYTVIFKYFPMVGAVVAFKRYQYNKGIFGSEWVGWTNFEFLFRSPDLSRIVRNTVGYNLSFIVLNMIGGIAIALLLYEITNRKALKIFQTIFFFPYFLSWVVVAYMVYAFLNPVSGMLNQWITGLGGEAVNWYNKSFPWIAIFPSATIWKDIGMGSIIYYAALMGIDTSYFEAARIDGANRFQMMARISLPFLIPIMTILIILHLGHIMEADFGLFYQLPMNSPMILSTTDVLDTYIFRALIDTGDIAMSSAAGIAKSAVGFVLVIAANGLVRRINKDNSLF